MSDSCTVEKKIIEHQSVDIDAKILKKNVPKEAVNYEKFVYGKLLN